MNKKKSKSSFAAVTYVTLLIMYIVASYFVRVTSRSDAVMEIMGQMIPAMTLTGILSSFANLCIIVMVVYSRRRGFIIALVLAVSQIPMVLMGLIRGVIAPSSVIGIINNILVITAIIMIRRRNKMIEDYQAVEIYNIKERQRGAERLFEQTATALVNAIDAKDEYSRGHSQRVAEYSRAIAGLLGKSDDECTEIYYAALLHDVGKIGIADHILNKVGKLTEEEYEVIKTHAQMGKQILSGISEYPYLSIAANHHHERYDGKGYPGRLKGDDIPEIARIIAVADSYDAMSSNRSYRDAMPQQIVREEIVKGAGTQFDPQMAKIMQHLIDIDAEYKMKERKEVRELAGKNDLKCTVYREEISEGIIVTSCITTIRLRSVADRSDEAAKDIPAIILFDSLDGRVHDEPKTIKDLNYFEYAEVRFDGNVTITGARKWQSDVSEHDDADKVSSEKDAGVGYTVETVRVKDHVLIRIDDGTKHTNITIALPDSARFAYIALTGEYCHITDVSIDKSEETVTEDYIPRIAPLITYIDRPEGDIPNVQVDGYRTDTTPGILIRDGLEISFHTMSLPTARLIWHCPFVNVFSSSDGRVNGRDYKEYALIRLDGENWESIEDNIRNELNVEKTASFIGWDEWKKNNKAGFDCKVSFTRNGNTVIMTTENFGLHITNITHLRDNEKVYAALTGDQVALTGIRIT